VRRAALLRCRYNALAPFISSSNHVVSRRGLAGAPAPEDLAVELRKSLTLPKSLQVRARAAFLCRWLRRSKRLRRLLFSLSLVTCVVVASRIACSRRGQVLLPIASRRTTASVVVAL
jgi:hypothetical protein